MQIRFATKEDKPAVKDLWSYSFHDSASYVDYYFSHRYRREHNVVLEKDGEVLASLLLNPYELCVGESRKKVSYIVGVSVLPQYRGEGYSSQLLKKSLRFLRERGEEMVLLMPIDTAIYRRYGFINTFFQDSFSVKVKGKTAVRSSLKLQKASTSQNDLSELRRLYQREMGSKHAYIHREEEDFHIRLDEMKREGGEVYFITRENEKIGYFLFFPSYQEKIGLVQELVAPSKEAVLRVMNFLYQHQTQFETALIQPVDRELFWASVEFDNQIEVKTSPFMMARVLNVKDSIQKHLTFQRPVILEVKDSLFDENQGYYLWNETGVCRTDSEEIADLCIDIEALTLLVMQAGNWETLMKTGTVRCMDPQLKAELLSADFDRKGNYSNDYV